MAARQSIHPVEPRQGQRQDGRCRPETLLRDRRGSALECAAIQDVLGVGKALDEDESQNRKTELDRMAAMLSRLGGRGYQVREGADTYGQGTAGIDPDSDSDLDEDNPQQGGGEGRS